MKIKIITLAILVCVFIVSCIKIQNANQIHNQNKTMNYPFSHHVFFWLNNPDSPEDRAAFEKGIKELIEIPEIKAYHLGKPAPVEERSVVDGSYTYSYLVFFDNIEGHDIYQDHPLHLKFIEECKHLWNKVVIYDSLE